MNATHFELSARADGTYQVVDTRNGNRTIPLKKAAALRVLKALRK
jgi:hypothetical protein